MGGQEGACCLGVRTDGGRERVQPVVLGFVAKFVQQFHAGEFTVGPFGAQGARLYARRERNCTNNSKR